MPSQEEDDAKYGAGRKWEEFYKGRLLDPGYQQYVRERYKPFLGAIIERAKLGDRIVEVGCGLGTITRVLADSMIRANQGFRAYDLNPYMVRYARQTLSDGYPVEVGNAFFPTNCKPDIVHSHGMLEHFTDDQIGKVIQAHIKDEARHAVHYVPGDKYEVPSFGDERLMPLEFWKEFGPTEAFAFNDGYDYCLIWDFYK